MTARFPRLLAPLDLGPVTVRNRMVMGAMHTRLETLDQPVERLVAFYRARAAGEIGLILTGGFAPHPDGRMDPESGVLDSVEAIDAHGHRRICEAVHAEGGVIVLQILHAGRYAELPECVGPSAIRAPIKRFTPRALTTAEVWQVVEQFVTTARLARQAGYDGVEIMGSEGYLINQFTAPRTNDRTDEFGGDLDGRLRLPVEIVTAVRAAVGEDFLVVYRISAVDLVPDGSTGDEVAELARRVDSAGANLINTGIGWHESGVPTIAASVPRGAWAFAVARVREAVTIPVMASNRINVPETAEELLAGGVADLVSMARPLLADPDFARKVRTGRSEEICTCIGCNQSCLDPIFTGRSASCLVNPRAGRETDFPADPGDRGRRRVAVVGAGPAGLACAVNAAELGHRVTVYDSAAAIGGQLNLARVVPGKTEFDEALRYFAVRLRELGVEVRLNHRVTAPELADGDDDTVVIATGIVPRRPLIPGIDHPSVVSYLDVLTGAVAPGRRVAIIGAGGIGFDVAEYLVGDPREAVDAEDFLTEWSVDSTLTARGGLRAVGRRPVTQAPRHEVTLMQRKPQRLGRSLGKTTGWILRARLAHAGVREIPGVTYHLIDDDGVHYSVDGVTELLPVDTVVICAGQDSERSLVDDLVTLGVDPLVIGGAHRAADLDAAAAIAQATRAAYDI